MSSNTLDPNTIASVVSFFVEDIDIFDASRHGGIYPALVELLEAIPPDIRVAKRCRGVQSLDELLTYMRVELHDEAREE